MKHCASLTAGFWSIM